MMHYVKMLALLHQSNIDHRTAKATNNLFIRTATSGSCVKWAS